MSPALAVIMLSSVSAARRDEIKDFQPESSHMARSTWKSENASRSVLSGSILVKT